MDDRILAHVQLLIVAKLRKQERFLLSWQIDPRQGSGRQSIWVDAGVPIGFRFAGSRSIQINQGWLEHLIDQSYTVGGAEITNEEEYESHTAS